MASDADVITRLVADFRSDDRTPPPVDVGRWVVQFEPDERPVLLRAVRRWLETYYWPRARVRAALESLADGLDLTSVAVVPVQPARSGQATLDRAFDRLLRDRGVAKRPVSAGAGLHVYLDDMCCTGRTLERHLRGFVDAVSPGARVVVFHLIEHTNDARGRRAALADVARARGVELTFDAAMRIENRTSTLGGLEVITPTPWSASAVAPDCRVPKRAFRERDLFGDGPLFDDALERDVVERALLRVGSRIALWPRKKPSAIRPLGFGDASSLGFGTVACTFHNAPNTMPPALWWSDPSSPDAWFPLLPRRVAG